MPIVHYLYLRLNFKWLDTLFLRGQHSNQGRVLWTVVYLQNKIEEDSYPLTSLQLRLLPVKVLHE